MLKLQEMDSDTLDVYMKQFTVSELVEKHHDELKDIVLMIQKTSKKKPVPPDIIIRCSDGENMSIPFHWTEFVP